MDEAVIKYYRRLLREDFPNSGALDNASVFIEAVGEKMINCGIPAITCSSISKSWIAES